MILKSRLVSTKMHIIVCSTDEKLNNNPLCLTLIHKRTSSLAVAPLAWVPWVSGNPSVFEQWVPEPITFETKK